MNSEGFKIGSVCVEERREVQCHTRSTLTWSLSADHDCQNNEWKADKILKLGWRAVEQRLSHLNLIILPGFIYSGWTCRFPAEPQREALRWESEPLWTMMKTEVSFFLLLTDSLLPLRLHPSSVRSISLMRPASFRLREALRGKLLHVTSPPRNERIVSRSVDSSLDLIF